MQNLFSARQTIAWILAAVGLCVAAGAAAQESGTEEKVTKDGSLHFEVTSIIQMHPSFRAPYSGDNSLISTSERKQTVTASAAMGVRLWRGAELYLTIEGLSGFGLSNTTGIAGFTNGDAQKGGSNGIVPYIPRGLLTQTWGFGGEREYVEDGLSKIAGWRDVSRLSLSIGKFPLTDFFNDNAYAHNPRDTFLNWSIWEAGGFDYAADVKGYTQGIVLDFNQKSWAFRAAYAQVPTEANSAKLDANLFQRGSYMAELEQRYKIGGQDGKLRLLGFVNRAFAGSWRQALVDPVDPVDIEPSRRTRTKFGFVVNIEQAITSDLGFFSRLSWNDGRTENVSFTDIDKSISAGFSLKGTSWQRPKDVVGIAGVLNGISGAHKRWFEAGGNGLLIGDGRLSYMGEKVLETYYNADLGRGWKVMFDYQFIANPAYNADRGPVSVISSRVHFEY